MSEAQARPAFDPPLHCETVGHVPPGQSISEAQARPAFDPPLHCETVGHVPRGRSMSGAEARLSVDPPLHCETTVMRTGVVRTSCLVLFGCGGRELSGGFRR